MSELSESELSESDEDDSASSIARRCSMMIRGAFWATDGMMRAEFEDVKEWNGRTFRCSRISSVMGPRLMEVK